jgi:hypothetical protein
MKSFPFKTNIAYQLFRLFHKFHHWKSTRSPVLKPNCIKHWNWGNWTIISNYKAQSIKAAIRRRHGEHYLDLSNPRLSIVAHNPEITVRAASTCCTYMCYNVIKASVYLQKSSHVLSYVNITNSGFANLRTLACFFTYYIMETPATLRPEHGRERSLPSRVEAIKGTSLII